MKAYTISWVAGRPLGRVLRHVRIIPLLPSLLQPQVIATFEESLWRMLAFKVECGEITVQGRE